MTQEGQELETVRGLPADQQERFMNMAVQDQQADRRQLKPEWTMVQLTARAAHYAHTLRTDSSANREMTHYRLVRHRDTSGVSGTGHVADCVVFPSGKAVVSWRTGTAIVSVFDSFDDASRIHGHGGDTEFQPVTGAA